MATRASRGWESRLRDSPLMHAEGRRGREGKGRGANAETVPRELGAGGSPWKVVGLVRFGQERGFGETRPHVELAEELAALSPTQSKSDCPRCRRRERFPRPRPGPLQWFFRRTGRHARLVEPTVGCPSHETRRRWGRRAPLRVLRAHRPGFSTRNCGSGARKVCPALPEQAQLAPMRRVGRARPDQADTPRFNLREPPNHLLAARPTDRPTCASTPPTPAKPALLPQEGSKELK
jgi:hypothetical protein